MSHAKKLTLTWAMVAVALVLAAVLAMAFGGDVTAYAEESTVQITFNNGKTDTQSNFDATVGQDYVLSIPEYTGYYMGSLIVDGSEMVSAIYNETPYIDSVQYDETASTFTFANVTVAHTVSVSYVAKSYAIVFNTDGAQGGNFSQWGHTDEEIVVATTPIKTGYVFSFWSEDGTNPYNMIMPAKSITLKAIWAPATDTKYVVKFLKQNLALDDDEEDEAERLTLYGTTGTTASYTPDAYKYDRFDYDSERSNTSTVIAADGTSEICIYYKRGQTVIYFDSMGGTPVASVAAMPGTSISAPATVPTKAGYTFSAWYQVNRPSAYHFGTMPGQDLYLEAHWTALDGIGYTVKFFKQISSALGYAEVEGDRITDLTGTAGEVVSYEPSTTMYEDYSFQRSKSTTSATLEGDGSTVLSIYYDIAKYTITLNAGKGELDDSIRVAHFGDEVSYPTPTREGYTFSGWYYGNNRIADGSYPFHKSVTLEAKWTALVYKVTFNTDGGSDVASLQVAYGGTVTRPETDPTKLNNTFLGWYTDEACTEEVDFSRMTITSDTTIYAKWEVNTSQMLIICAMIFALLSIGAVIIVNVVRKH